MTQEVFLQLIVCLGFRIYESNQPGNPESEGGQPQHDWPGFLLILSKRPDLRIRLSQ